MHTRIHTLAGVIAKISFASGKESKIELGEGNVRRMFLKYYALSTVGLK